MTPNEKNVVKSLVAVAWADGEVQAPEAGIIDGLLWAFGASDEDETEIREYAKKKRTLDEAPVDALERADKEMLLANAALLTHADGEQTKAEQKVLARLVKLIAFSDAEAKPIIADAKKRGAKLASRMG